ncbi:MAG: hypothetical protein RJA78_984 [Actinomycetota bacterium]|jgi:type II secretory pathway component PulK
MPSQVKRGLAMGRGRQKAKNTKVARELKYFSPNTDLTALQAELATSSNDEPEYEDKWADLYPDEQDTTDSSDSSDGGSGSAG